MSQIEQHTQELVEEETPEVQVMIHLCQFPQTGILFTKLWTRFYFEILGRGTVSVVYVINICCCGSGGMGFNLIHSAKTSQRNSEQFLNLK